MPNPKMGGSGSSESNFRTCFQNLPRPPEFTLGLFFSPNSAHLDQKLASYSNQVLLPYYTVIGFLVPFRAGSLRPGPRCLSRHLVYHLGFYFLWPSPFNSVSLVRCRGLADPGLLHVPPPKEARTSRPLSPGLSSKIGRR